MIHKDRLSQVISLCRQVEDLCSQMQQELAKEEASKEEVLSDKEAPYYFHRYWASTKVSAALRRRSMDLTRALADLRARDR